MDFVWIEQWELVRILSFIGGRGDRKSVPIPEMCLTNSGDRFRLIKMIENVSEARTGALTSIRDFVGFEAGTRIWCRILGMISNG